MNLWLCLSQSSGDFVFFLSFIFIGSCELTVHCLNGCDIDVSVIICDWFDDGIKCAKKRRSDHVVHFEIKVDSKTI